MLEIIIISLAVLLAIILGIGGWFIGGYNTLSGFRQNIKTMFSNIKTEYQRRADLLYNLAEATKSYAKFEKSTLTEVIAARSGIGNTPKEMAKGKKQLDGLFSKLMLVVERYPKLRATEQYQMLMKETRVTEDRINIARTEYNNTVRDYNLFVVSFPSNVLARMFHFKEEEYFKNEAETNKCPKLDLRI
jgi:LemA protein